MTASEKFNYRRLHDLLRAALAVPFMAQVDYIELAREQVGLPQRDPVNFFRAASYLFRACADCLYSGDIKGVQEWARPVILLSEYMQASGRHSHEWRVAATVLNTSQSINESQAVRLLKLLADICFDLGTDQMISSSQRMTPEALSSHVASMPRRNGATPRKD